MASTETKLVSRIVLCAVVFISLSASTAAEEARRCYWCGPLAEQVHRSRRAPACTGADPHVTVCDPGFPHCAVVATSPPHIESRYCVKFYQDECYSLYCNSTKTWRMTCPCRGDLCNGPNTEREEEAFIALRKLVAKTNNARFKRAMTSSGFIMMKRNNEISNATTDEKATESNDSLMAAVNVGTNVNIMSEINAQNNETILNLTNDNEIMQSDQPVERVASKIEGSTTADLPEPVQDTVINNIKESKTNILLSNKDITTPDELPTLIKVAKNSSDHNNNESKTDILTTTKEIIIPKTENKDTVVPTDPTNAIKKNIAKTTVPTSTHSSNLSTDANMRSNNSATRLDTLIITIVMGIMLQY